MKKIIDLKYTVIGLVVAGVIGYLFSLFAKLSFWLAFGLVVLSMVVNGLLAEYEDNLPGGFNNPMSDAEIQAEKIRRRKKLLPYRITFWFIFILVVSFFTWLLLK
jgi:hypothetical protein